MQPVIMQRLFGRYSLKSKPVQQLDYQIEPQHWHSFEGFKLPRRGPFTQVICKHGTACLYVSQPGEVPLYYSTTPGWIHWHEQKLALPGRPQRINQGEAVIWTPQSIKTRKIDELPHPEISPAPSIRTAQAQYLDLLKQSIARRIPPDTHTVAVSQSGGVDSLLVSWALLQLDLKIVPLTVCFASDDSDIATALDVLPQMGGPTPIPIRVNPSQLEKLTREAVFCFEDADLGNVRMAIGNILMARYCKEKQIPVIFNGHAQDDMHGVGGLALGGYKKNIGTPSERWRDARCKETHDATGMVKMFASSFRRYGIAVRMPYYDADLLEWAFSQSTDILPVHHAKPFVRELATTVLPPGPWLDKKYNSTGYITGAGFYGDAAIAQVEYALKEMRNYLREFRSMGWSRIYSLHNQPA